jgi:SagB-type dehydrogenase family enzyme
MSNRDIEAARAYHEDTKHSEARLRAGLHSLDWDNRPIPFKLYRDLEPIPLPREVQPGDVSTLGALHAPGRGATAETRTPDLRDLARVLYYSAGITKRRRSGDGEFCFRAAPSTGALYHIDLYAACGDLAGLAAGVYHYGPHDHALRRLREGDYRAAFVGAAGAEPTLARAPVIVASASTYWRNAWKYRSRTYRHCFWDGGALHAQSPVPGRLRPRLRSDRAHVPRRRGHRVLLASRGRQERDVLDGARPLRAPTVTSGAGNPIDDARPSHRRLRPPLPPPAPLATELPDADRGAPDLGGSTEIWEDLQKSAA